MYALFARIRFSRKWGTIEFAVSSPANPCRHMVSLFARSVGSGRRGWALLASFYSLDFANAFWLAAGAVRASARGRKVLWWNGRNFRGKKPLCRGIPSWSHRLVHAGPPALRGLRWPPLRRDCPF